MPQIPLHVPQLVKPKAKRLKRQTWRWLMWVIAALVLLFVAANAGLVLVYWAKVPPHVNLGSQYIGNMSYKKLDAQPSGFGIEPTVTLRYAAVNTKVQPSMVGISVDTAASVKGVRSGYLHWLPIIAMVKHTTVPVVLRADESRFQPALDSLAAQFAQEPQGIHVAFDGQAFVSAPASDGYHMNVQATHRAILQTVAHGQQTVQVPVVIAKAPAHSPDVSADVALLNKQLATAVSFATFGGAKAQPTTVQQAAWFATSGSTMTLSGDRIAAYLDQVAADQRITLINKKDLVTATTYALTHQQALNFRLVTQGNIVHTYCTAVRGVDQSGLGDLSDKLAAVYADVRGWSDEGRIGFEHVANGCQYTVWLSSPDQMASFGSICDNYYNCQAGQNVVVNNDRWLHATPQWNTSGGTLEDYHVLIIDHETGHRLGFLDNPTCPGAGQPAYVMMQQSIDLKGCAFNIWPTATELQNLKAML